MTGLKTLLLAALTTLTLLACASDAGEAPEPIPMPDIDLSTIPNASTPLDGVLAAGQLSPEQMQSLRDAGYRSFVSLRVAGERGAGWEEEFAAENDIRFVRMPVAGAAEVDEAHARELGLLMDAEEKPMVVYCGSSNRVGALFGLKAYHVDGKSAQEAFELGTASGVTSLGDHFRDQLGL